MPHGERLLEHLNGMFAVACTGFCVFCYLFGKDKQDPLHFAACEGHEEVVELLLDANVDPGLEIN